MGQNKPTPEADSFISKNIVELQPWKVRIGSFRGTADVLFVLRSTCLHTAASHWKRAHGKSRW